MSESTKKFRVIFYVSESVKNSIIEAFTNAEPLDGKTYTEPSPPKPEQTTRDQWRQPNVSGDNKIAPASDNQLNYIRSMGGHPEPGITRGEADLMIKGLLAYRPSRSKY